MRKRLLVVVLSAVVMIAGSAMATTVNLSQGSYTASLNVGASSATLTLGGPSSGFFVSQAAINIGSSVTTTSGSASSGTWFFGNSQNSVQPCNGSSSGNWLCAADGTGQAGNGLQLTWNFTGTPGATPYSVQFAVCSTSTACGPNDSNFVTNFSQSGESGNGTSQLTTTPEPASLGLLATGLLGLGGLARRRK